jgi:hypothetical protein
MWCSFLPSPEFAYQPIVCHLEGLGALACANSQSSRSLQAEIEEAGFVQAMEIVQQLCGCVCAMIDSPHGNHVLAKAINVLPKSSTEFIVREVLDYAFWLATHQFGCRIFQRLIEHHDLSSPEMTKLINDILFSIEFMAHDEFGNFVIQHLLEHGTDAHKARIGQELLQSDVVGWACDAHATNVIQKYLENVRGSCTDSNFSVDMLLSGPKLLDDTTGQRVLGVLLDQTKCSPLNHQKAIQFLETQGVHAISEGCFLEKALYNKYWSLAVQEVIKVYGPGCAGMIWHGFHGRVYDAVKSLHANYLVCEAMRALPISFTGLVAQELKTKVVDVGTDQYGYWVLLSLIQNNDARHIRNVSEVMKKILEFALQLSCDKYGNWVIQEIVQRGSMDDLHRLVVRLTISPDAMRQLAQDPYGHHVIRQILQRGGLDGLQDLKLAYEEAAKNRCPDAVKKHSHRSSLYGLRTKAALVSYMQVAA